MYTRIVYSYKRFEWGPEKSEADLRERGLDFELASGTFEDPTPEKPDRREDYGEVRVIATGL